MKIFERYKQLQSLQAECASIRDGRAGIGQAFAGGQGIAAADFSGSSVDQSTTNNFGGFTFHIAGNATREEILMGVDSALAKGRGGEG